MEMEAIANATAHSGPTETITGTARQFAGRFGLLEIDEESPESVKGYVHATALLRFLKRLGIAEEIGKEPTGRGKGAVIWKVPAEILIKM